MRRHRRPAAYLVALVTLDPEEVKLAAEDGVAKDLSAWPDDERVELIQEHVDQVNQRYARVEQVKKFKILLQDFSQEGGELTPTMKVKRAVVANKYEPQIEELT